jgi:hypothetical protein
VRTEVTHEGQAVELEALAAGAGDDDPAYTLPLAPAPIVAARFHVGIAAETAAACAELAWVLPGS